MARKGGGDHPEKVTQCSPDRLRPPLRAKHGSVWLRPPASTSRSLRSLHLSCLERRHVTRRTARHVGPGQLSTNVDAGAHLADHRRRSRREAAQATSGRRPDGRPSGRVLAPTHWLAGLEELPERVWPHALVPPLSTLDVTTRHQYRCKELDRPNRPISPHDSQRHAHSIPPSSRSASARSGT